MSLIGPSLASSVSGSQQAERAQAKATDKAERDKRGARAAGRPEDEYEHVDQVEGSEAPRSLAGNEREEAHEDRQEQAGYRQGANAPNDEDRPRIDVEV